MIAKTVLISRLHGMFAKTALVNRLHEKQMFDTEFKAFIKDKKFSLDERWDLFKFACENNIFVNVSSFSVKLKTLESCDGFSWYDAFGIEKYQTVEFTEIVETLIEREVTVEFLNELKEDILAKGYSGFVMNW